MVNDIHNDNARLSEAESYMAQARIAIKRLKTGGRNFGNASVTDVSTINTVIADAPDLFYSNKEIVQRLMTDFDRLAANAGTPVPHGLHSSVLKLLDAELYSNTMALSTYKSPKAHTIYKRSFTSSEENPTKLIAATIYHGGHVAQSLVDRFPNFTDSRHVVMDAMHVNPLDPAEELRKRQERPKNGLTSRRAQRYESVEGDWLGKEAGRNAAIASGSFAERSNNRATPFSTPKAAEQEEALNHEIADTVIPPNPGAFFGALMNLPDKAPSRRGPNPNKGRKNPKIVVNSFIINAFSTIGS